MTSLVNEPLRKSKMPLVLKESVINPILKVTNSMKCEDFRPVNTLSILDKIIETVIYDNLLHHVKENIFLSICQSGFREKHVTESALMLVVEERKHAK